MTTNQDQIGEKNTPEIEQPKPVDPATLGIPPLEIATFFDPKRGLVVGIVPRGGDPTQPIASIAYGNLSVLESELMRAVAHTRDTILQIAHQQGFQAGIKHVADQVAAQNEAAQKQAMDQQASGGGNVVVDTALIGEKNTPDTDNDTVDLSKPLAEEEDDF